MDFTHLVKEEIVDKRTHVSENFKGGTCACTVTAAEENTSQNGNSQIILSIKAFDETLQEANIKLFLPFTEKMMWKIKHFCEAADLKEEWYNKTLSADKCVGETFDANISFNKEYDKWNVKYFISIEKYETFKDGKKPDIKASSPIEEDDIPF